MSTKPSPHELEQLYEHYYADTHLSALWALFELGVEWGRQNSAETVDAASGTEQN